MNLRLVITLLCLPYMASEARAADESRTQVEQRVRLVARLVTDAATVQRISSSGDRAAIGHHDEGRLHQSLAEDALRRGELATARREADEAMRHLSMARRLVPDALARQALARQRHQQMQANLDKLIAAWRQRAGPAVAEDSDHFAAFGLMATAHQLGSEGRWEEGVQVLAAAERHVLEGLQRTLSTRELDYTPRAGTPAEELQFELQRHEAMSDLLPLALQDLKPSAQAQALIDRYGQASRALRGQALQRQRAGEVTQALADVRNAMLYLQRALGAAGVVTPAPSDDSAEVRP